MNRTMRTGDVAFGGLVLAGAILALAAVAFGGDWPQWRGPNRDAKVADFTPPQTWPKELTAKWKTAVGVGVGTPALVGDKVYVFARQGNDEVAQCLSAADGKPLWQVKYQAAVNVQGSAGSFPGPRSSPAVAEGKVVMLDEGATVSCLDAADGKVVWRKDFTQELGGSAWPGFYTALSPLIVDGMCVVHLGGRGKGTVYALELNNGEPKWKREGEGPAYASPVLMTVDGGKQIVQETERSVMGLSPADGKVLWQLPVGGGGRGRGGPGGPGGGRGGPGAGAGGAGGAPGGAPGGNLQAPPPDGGAGRGPGGRGPGGGRGGPGGGGMRGGGMAYNAASPVVEGQTLIVTAPGAGTKAFKIEKAGDSFTTKELWTNPEVATQFNTPVFKDGRLYGLSSGGNLFCLDAASGKTLWQGNDRVGERGFGSIVDVGPVLLALTPASQLLVFKPSEKAYEEVARIKVADTATHAYPVLGGNRLFIKDKDSVMMYTIE